MSHILPMRSYIDADQGVDRDQCGGGGTMGKRAATGKNEEKEKMRREYMVFKMRETHWSAAVFYGTRQHRHPPTTYTPKRGL